MPKLTLKLSEDSVGKVFLDGVELPGVMGISICAVAGDRVTVDLLVMAEIDAEIDAMWEKISIERKKVIDNLSKGESLK